MVKYFFLGCLPLLAMESFEKTLHKSPSITSLGEILENEKSSIDEQFTDAISIVEKVVILEAWKWSIKTINNEQNVKVLFPNVSRKTCSKIFKETFEMYLYSFGEKVEFRLLKMILKERPDIFDSTLHHHCIKLLKKKIYDAKHNLYLQEHDNGLWNLIAPFLPQKLNDRFLKWTLDHLSTLPPIVRETEQYLRDAALTHASLEYVELLFTQLLQKGTWTFREATNMGCLLGCVTNKDVLEASFHTLNTLPPPSNEDDQLNRQWIKECIENRLEMYDILVEQAIH